MTAESIQARMKRGDKMLKLFEQGVDCAALMERFRIRYKQNISTILQEARKRREKAKENAQ